MRVLFQPAFLETKGEFVMSIPQVAISAPNGQLPGLLAMLLAEARAAIASDPGRADQCLDRCETLLLQPHAPVLNHERSAPNSGGLAPWQVSRVQRHVDANLTDRLTTAELAALVRLSDNHFARAFKATLGCPPHAYVVSRRISYAKELILQTDTPLCEVALTCGLADQAHLSRLFRRIVGDSPSAWRRQHRTE